LFFLCTMRKRGKYNKVLIAQVHKTHSWWKSYVCPVCPHVSSSELTEHILFFSHPISVTFFLSLFILLLLLCKNLLQAVWTLPLNYLLITHQLQHALLVPTVGDQTSIKTIRTGAREKLIESVTLNIRSHSPTFIYLRIYCLFNNTANRSDRIASDHILLHNELK
jgi:hypothetical protein